MLVFSFEIALMQYLIESLFEILNISQRHCFVILSSLAISATFTHLFLQLAQTIENLFPEMFDPQQTMLVMSPVEVVEVFVNTLGKLDHLLMVTAALVVGAVAYEVAHIQEKLVQPLRRLELLVVKD